MGGVPRWLVGVIINVMGSVSINFGTNLMKLSHNDKERRAREAALQQGHEKRGQFEEVPEEASGSGSLEEPDMVIRKNGGLLVSLLNRLRSWRRVAPSNDGSSNKALKVSLQERWRMRQPIGDVCRSMFMPDKPIKIWLREKIWGVGVVIFVSGSILVFISFAYAPQSMLAALGSSQFVSNVFFARFVLGERITPRVVGATCIIIGGQILIVLFSAHISRTYNALDLMALYNQTYLTYLGSIFIVCVCLQLVYRQYRHYEALDKPLPYSSTVLPVTYAMFSALVGTFSVLQSKCLSALLGHTLSGDNQFRYFFTWIVLIMWITLTIFWLHRMNTALLLFDGLFIIPVLQVFWTFFAIVGGGVYFQEFQEYSPKNLGGFCCGVIIIFVGVVLLSPRRSIVPEEEFQALVEEGGDEEACASPASAIAATVATPSALGSLESPGVVTPPASVDSLGRSREGSHSGDTAHQRHQRGSAGSDGGGGGSGRQLVRRGSLEVLERRNSRLISFNTMPFVTNDQGLASFVDQIAPPEVEVDEHGHVRQGSGRDLLSSSARSSGARHNTTSSLDGSRSSRDKLSSSLGTSGSDSSRSRKPGSGDHGTHLQGASDSGRRPSLDEIMEAKRGGPRSAAGGGLGDSIGHHSEAKHPVQGGGDVEAGGAKEGGALPHTTTAHSEASHAPPK